MFAGPAVFPSTRRVLVVDDESIIRTVLRRTLTRLGWDVFEATDGQHALERIEELGCINAIVCDVRMPRMTGLVMYDHLAATRPRLAARTILCSGDTLSEEVSRCVVRENLCFLEKPFAPATLEAALERVAAAC